MSRISERLVTVATGVRCPGCGKMVVPSEPVPTPQAQPAEGQGEGRWSFIWRAPSGPACPECNFPLGRYARRAKWVRLFGLGVIMLTLTGLLSVLRLMGGGEPHLSLAQRIVGAAGILAFLVGGVGIVLGGRRQST